MAVNTEMAQVPPDSDDEPILPVHGKERTAGEEVPLLPKDADSVWTTRPPQIPYHPYPSAATPHAGVPVPQPSGPNVQQSSSSNVSVCSLMRECFSILYLATRVYNYI